MHYFIFLLLSYSVTSMQYILQQIKGKNKSSNVRQTLQLCLCSVSIQRICMSFLSAVKCSFHVQHSAFWCIIINTCACVCVCFNSFSNACFHKCSKGPDGGVWPGHPDSLQRSGPAATRSHLEQG